MPTLEEQLKLLRPTPSRFERLMTPANFLDEILALKRRQQVGRPPPRPKRTVVAKVPGDPQFEAELHFGPKPGGSDDITEGVFWTEPLVDPAGPPAHYYVRLRIAQHMVDPLLQGFRVRWWIPAGWAWADGLGAYTVDEAVSNPLAITRLARRSGALGTKGFRCAIVERFQA